MNSNNAEPVLTATMPTSAELERVEARGEPVGQPAPLLTTEEMNKRATAWVDDFMERRAGSICS